MLSAADSNHFSLRSITTNTNASIYGHVSLSPVEEHVLVGVSFKFDYNIFPFDSGFTALEKLLVT
jgi:hypothetical protein